MLAEANTMSGAYVKSAGRLRCVPEFVLSY